MGKLEFSFDRIIDPKGLSKLMKQTSWGGKRTVNGLRKMLRLSTIKLGIWDGNNLVGFARVLSDGVYRALIEDIIVDESYRGRGIGTKIMQTLVDKLSNIEHVYLFTGTEKLQQYYKRFGFSLTPYFSMRILHVKRD